MAGGKSDPFRNYVLDYVLGGTSYTPLTTVYIALFTVTPSDTTSGTEVSTSGTAYARQSVTNNSGSWSASTTGVKQNLNLIDFGTATASWGTIVAGAIMSASTSGYILYWGPLTSSKTINTNDGFRIPINGLTVTES